MTIALTLGVVVLALVCFVGEWLPVDITAIGIMLLLMLLGLVTPEEGISGFSNSATITVMAMFILSAGIARTGVIQIISNLLMQWGGKNSTQQILSLGAIVGPISAFINNTAVVAVFMPIVEDWCRKQSISTSKLMIPLSYAAILGGVVTTIGTSTNVLASGISNQLGYGEFSLFEFTAIGLITFLVGTGYLALASPRLLPDRRPPNSDNMDQSYDLKDYVSEVVITPGSSLIGKTLRSSQLQRKFDIDVLELIQNDIHFPQPLANKVLSAGDVLLVRANREDLLKIKNEKEIDILPEILFKDLEASLSSGEETVAEVLVLSNSSLIGSTLKDSRFRQRYNATVLAIRRGEELIRERLGKVPLRFGDVLLVQGPRESFLGLQTSRDVLVIEQLDLEILRRDKAWIALAILLGVIVVAALDWLPILVTSLVGVFLMVVTGCLKPGELYTAVRWDIIFLLACLIPLGLAMDKSGATEWLADSLIAAGGGLSGYWLLVFFYLITSLLTEILSNNATVVLLLPVAAQVAEKLSLNPFAFMFAVVLAASSSFITPIGYQTNTMVYGPGGYRFLDFVRIGLPLNMLLVVVIPPLIMAIYGLQPQ
ncbi:SLC13 family permease [Thermocoleostomius sinensis]|uniref:SLC13 family permease n=1 Tax=Thermocoleostomius sinensis A174 TaxID=2016057 RepID=A0A9E8ZJ99_9CYAN|nr:SLC13 family permease [Thermocoleostomius sinensis]WAL62772.1 SLC13 family permease [Thermocoleostomius sinensis A174]